LSQQADIGPGPLTLDDAIATLHAREINCGCEIFWDGGLKVCIGDIMNGMNGHHSETMFSQQNMGMAGQWLVDEVGLFLKALLTPSDLT
jgi:hypothetical protein